MLPLLLALLSSYVASEQIGDKCKYPTDSYNRLPRPNKRYFLECSPSNVYDEKECPADTEFDMAMMNCIYKGGEQQQQKLPPNYANAGAGQRILKPSETSSDGQWPFYSIELHSSCTSDGWCPHDPAKLQYCDVNGEQFMQCTNTGWTLKACPPGSIFTGHLGRCVDPRELQKPFDTKQGFQPNMPGKSQIRQIADGGINQNFQQIAQTNGVNQQPPYIDQFQQIPQQQNYVQSQSNQPTTFGQFSQNNPSQQASQSQQTWTHTDNAFQPFSQWNNAQSSGQNGWTQANQQETFTQQSQQQQQPTVITGQTITLTPEQAAALPQGKLVWTTGKQAQTLPESGQGLALGSLVVDTSNLNQLATSSASVQNQQDNRDNFYSNNNNSPSSVTNYNSWSVPDNGNANVQPTTHTDQIPDSQNYPSVIVPVNQINSNNFVQSPFSHKILSSFQQQQQQNQQQSILNGVHVNNPSLSVQSTWNGQSNQLNAASGSQHVYSNNYAGQSPQASGQQNAGLTQPITSYQWYLQNRGAYSAINHPYRPSSFATYSNYPYQQWPYHVYTHSPAAQQQQQLLQQQQMQQQQQQQQLQQQQNGWQTPYQQYPASPTWVTHGYQSNQQQPYQSNQQPVVQQPYQSNQQQAYQPFNQQQQQQAYQPPGVSSVASNWEANFPQNQYTQQQPQFSQTQFSSSGQSPQNFIVGQNAQHAYNNNSGHSASSTSRKLQKNKEQSTNAATKSDSKSPK